MHQQSSDHTRRTRPVHEDPRPNLELSVYDLYDIRLTDGAIFRGVRLTGVRVQRQHALLIFHLGNQTLKIHPIKLDKIKPSKQDRGIAYEQAPWGFDEHGEDVNGVSIE